MPKVDSSSESGQDSFVTIHISKRTALEIAAVLGIILGLVLWRQYEKRIISASASQSATASASAPTSPTNIAASGPSQRQNAPREQVHPTSYTPEFGADDLSDSQPSNNNGADANDPNTSPAANTPQDASYTEMQAYATSDPPPPIPAPVPEEPERNRPERSNSGENSNEPPADKPSKPTPDQGRDPVNLNGAGATSPNPIYQKWFAEYHLEHPQIQVNYQSIGSGGGIKQLQMGTVDFAASDGPMNNKQLAQTPTKVVQIPTVLNAVVITYNVPGVNRALWFSPDVLADIFLGKIQTWSDPRLQRTNPGLLLPDARITVVHRSDSSGSTYVFADYLSKISPEWLSRAGRATTINWPVGLGGKGNEGVAGSVKQTEGGIGYVDFIYAFANKLPMGNIQNAAGQFIAPDLRSIQAAASSIPASVTDLHVSLTNPPGRTAYPIASFTWFLVPQGWSDKVKKSAFQDFLYWMVNYGESMAPPLGYAPLPQEVQKKIRQEIHDL